MQRLAEERQAELVRQVRFFAWPRFRIGFEPDCVFITLVCAAEAGLDQRVVATDYCAGRLNEALALASGLADRNNSTAELTDDDPIRAELTSEPSPPQWDLRLLYAPTTQTQLLELDPAAP